MYFSFIVVGRLLFTVMCVCAAIYYLIPQLFCLYFSLAACLLPEVTNPEALAIESVLFAQEISQSFRAAGWTDRPH